MIFRPLIIVIAFAVWDASAVPFRLDSLKPAKGGSQNSGTPLVYSELFDSGKGSYQGAHFVGETLQSHDNPLLQNSGDADELAWVGGLISGNLPALPQASDVTLSEESGRLINFTLTSEWDYGYIMAKWAGGQNSSDHGLWYISAGDALKIQLPNDLSHSRIWLHALVAPPPEVPVLSGTTFTRTEPENLVVAVSDRGSSFSLLVGALALLLGIFAPRVR